MARLVALVSFLVAGLVAAQVASADTASSSPVVFTRATAGPGFMSWASAGTPTNSVLVMYDTAGTPVARYHLEMAWPSKIDIGSFDASKNEISIESLEISHDGLRLDVGTDNKDPDGAYMANGISGTVSFAGRQAHGVLYPCARC
jgi:T4-like virus tail tube protein gp19